MDGGGKSDEGAKNCACMHISLLFFKFRVADFVVVESNNSMTIFACISSALPIQK